MHNSLEILEVFYNLNDSKRNEDMREMERYESERVGRHPQSDAVCGGKSEWERQQQLCSKACMGNLTLLSQ